jgi:hypothetical protein
MGPKKTSAKVPKKNKNESRDQPFPSPTESNGPPVPPPRAAPSRRLLLTARSGSSRFNEALPIGFPFEHNMCYRNAALSLLMNIAPFVAYLDQFSLQNMKTGENILIELGDMATVYWSSNSKEERTEKLGEIISKLWAHLLYLNNANQAETAGWGPFLDSEEHETQQDAGDFLENLLLNGNGESHYSE